MTPNRRTMILLVAFLLLALLVLRLVSRAPQDTGSETDRSPGADELSPGDREASPTPEESPEPTIDPRVEDGGVVDKNLPAAAALPKVTKTPEPIKEKNLTE